MLAGLLIGVLVLLLNERGVFKRLELMTLDLRYKVNEGKRYKRNEVVLVVIRPEDIKELGKFSSWPRSYYAQVSAKQGQKSFASTFFSPPPARRIKTVF